MGGSEAPDGLAEAGLGLWESVQDGYELRADEERLLEAACRTQDELVTLEAALVGVDPVVAGSTGQDRPHPLYAEVRAHRLALRQLLTAVGLDEEDESAGASRSHAGRQLARQRHRLRGAA